MTAVAEPDVRAARMRVRALRRLSATELGSVADFLELAERMEADWLGRLPLLRHAADVERRARVERGIPGHGPYALAYRESLYLIRSLTEAREQTTETEKAGRVPRRPVPKLDT